MTWLALAAGLVLGAEPFTLAWDAPPECPDQPAAAKAIHALLRRAPKPGAPHVDARARLWREARWRLHLETTVDGVHGARELEGASCAEVATATELIIALAIDPDALETPEPAPPRPAPRPPPSRPLDPPPAPAPAPAPPPEPPAEAPPAAATPEPAPVPPPPPDAAAIASPSVPGLRVAVFAAAALDVGTLPLVGPGVAGGVSLRLGALRAQALAIYFPPREAQGPRPGTSGAISLAGGGLRLGALLHDGWLEVGVDAGLDAGALAGHGVGFDAPADGQGPWLGVLAGATAARALSAHWALRLTAEAGLTALGPGFSGDGALLHRPNLVFFRGLLGIELRL